MTAHSIQNKNINMKRNTERDRDTREVDIIGKQTWTSCTMEGGGGQMTVISLGDFCRPEVCRLSPLHALLRRPKVFLHLTYPYRRDES
jgi:hypothetical protein